MIKYNSNTINDWNLGNDNIIKVYRNNVVCYYKITTSGGTTSQTPCFAVVENISSYIDREFEDVFNTSDGKWYKLNNLNQYEEYGVYGNGRNITYYEGKLTVDDGYEYQYSGDSWVNMGQVSGSSNQVVWFDPAVAGYDSASFEIGHYWGEGYKMVCRLYLQGTYSSDVGSFWNNNNKTPLEFSFYSNGFYLDGHNPTSTSSPSVYTGDYSFRVMRQSSLKNYTSGQILLMTFTYGNVKVELEETGAVIANTGATRTGFSWYNGLYLPKIQSASNRKVHVSSIQIYNANNELVNDLKFIKNNGATGANEISMYDSVLGVTYNNTTSNVPSYHIVEEDESGGIFYPVYYEEKTTPPNNIVFSTMSQAEQYECPWWGMTGIIGGTDYLFCTTNEWLTKYYYQEVTGDYLCDNGNKYKKMQEYDRQKDGTFSATTNYVIGDLIEYDSPDCQITCTYNFCGEDANGNSVTINNGSSTLASANFSTPYPVNGVVGYATETIGQYCFQNVKNTLSALTLATSVTTIQHEAFMENALLTTLTIPSSVTTIDFWAFTRCTGLQEVIFKGTTPPTFTNQHSGVFHDYCPPVIYVPDAAVETYRAIDGSVWTNQTWSSSIIQPISNR